MTKILGLDRIFHLSRVGRMINKKIFRPKEAFLGFFWLELLTLI